MAEKEQLSPRDRLLDTAGQLFRRCGFQAVDIDRILVESGVAKKTMYHHFASKDRMIAPLFWVLSSGDAQQATQKEYRFRGKSSRFSGREADHGHQRAD